MNETVFILNQTGVDYTGIITVGVIILIITIIGFICLVIQAGNYNN